MPVSLMELFLILINKESLIASQTPRDIAKSICLLFLCLYLDYYKISTEYGRLPYQERESSWT